MHRIGPFQGEISFRTGCQFGVPSGTYPPKKSPSAPPPQRCCAFYHPCLSLLQNIRLLKVGKSCYRNWRTGVRVSSWAGVRRKGNKEEDKERGGLTPFPTLSPYFSAYISLIHPHDLNSWNGLKVIVIFGTKSVHVTYFTVLRQTSVLQQVTPMTWLPRVLIDQKSVSSRKLYQHFFYLWQNKLLVSVARFTLAQIFFFFFLRSQICSQKSSQATIESLLSVPRRADVSRNGSSLLLT